MRPYDGPTLADGLPDMDSAEWNDWCSSHWHECAEHLQLLDDMQRAALPDELDQDVRDLLRLIGDKAGDYMNTDHGDMRLPLTRSLHRLVIAAARSFDRAGHKNMNGTP